MPKVVSHVIYLNNAPVLCGRSGTLTVNTETAEKTTTGSGDWREYEGLVNNWTASLEGVIYINSGLSIADIRDLQKSLTPVDVTMIAEDANGAQYTETGTAIITSTQTQQSVGNVPSFNIELQGSGQLVSGTAQVITGNYPSGFQIIQIQADTPDQGYITLSFVWNAANPIPVTYEIKQVDEDGNIVMYSNIPEAGHTKNIVISDQVSYSFYIRSVYAGGVSNYSPAITYP